MTRRNPVQKTASLHEKTVQAVATDSLAPLPSATKKGREKPTEKLTRDVKVHEAVWAKAQELLAGVHGFTKIEIIDDTTVVVR